VRSLYYLNPIHAPRNLTLLFNLSVFVQILHTSKIINCFRIACAGYFLNFLRCFCRRVAANLDFDQEEKMNNNKLDEAALAAGCAPRCLHLCTALVLLRSALPDMQIWYGV